MTALVVQWSEFLDTDLEVPGSISVLPNFLSSNGSGVGFPPPREDK
jgi:hypothetical protein